MYNQHTVKLMQWLHRCIVANTYRALPDILAGDDGSSTGQPHGSATERRVYILFGRPPRGSLWLAMLTSLSYLGLREPVVGLATPGHAWCDLGDAESSKPSHAVFFRDRHAYAGRRTRVATISFRPDVATSAARPADAVPGSSCWRLFW